MEPVTSLQAVAGIGGITMKAYALDWSSIKQFIRSIELWFLAALKTKNGCDFRSLEKCTYYSLR